MIAIPVSPDGQHWIHLRNFQPSKRGCGNNLTATSNPIDYEQKGLGQKKAGSISQRVTDGPGEFRMSTT